MLCLGKKKDKKEDKKIDLASDDSSLTFDDELDKLDTMMDSDKEDKEDFTDDIIDLADDEADLPEKDSFLDDEDITPDSDESESETFDEIEKPKVKKIICPHCDHLTPGHGFCENCGKDIKEAIEATIKTETPTEDIKKESKKSKEESMNSENDSKKSSKKQKCPHCGKKTMGLEFCEHCGKNTKGVKKRPAGPKLQVQSITCPFCSQNTLALNFCEKCGKSLKEVINSLKERAESASTEDDLSDLDNDLEDHFRNGDRLNKRKVKTGFSNTLFGYTIGDRLHSDTKARKDMGEKFVDEMLCKECGLCARGCPYNAITLNPKPQFDMTKCYGCWYCYNHCPEKAIYTEKFRGEGYYPKPNDQIQEKLKVSETSAI